MLLVLMSMFVSVNSFAAIDDREKFADLESGFIKRTIDTETGIICYAVQAEGGSGSTAISCLKQPDPRKKNYKGLDKKKCISDIRVGYVGKFLDEATRIACYVAQGSNGALGVSISCLPY